MREIKFRFWNTKLGRMSKPYGLGVMWENLCEEWGIFNWGDVIKRQFTGLKDKNGKEIFEGDIVKKDYEKNLFIICFGEGHQGEPADGTYPYWGWYLGGEHYLDPTAFKGKEVEVIGNVWENPELLERRS